MIIIITPFFKSKLNIAFSPPISFSSVFLHGFVLNDSCDSQYYLQKDTTWFKPTYIYKVWEQFLKSQQ